MIDAREFKRAFPYGIQFVPEHGPAMNLKIDAVSVAADGSLQVTVWGPPYNEVTYKISSIEEIGTGWRAEIAGTGTAMLRPLSKRQGALTEQSLESASSPQELGDSEDAVSGP